MLSNKLQEWLQLKQHADISEAFSKNLICSLFRQTLRKNIEPDLVFMPSLNDVHQDHATIAQEGLRAFKGSTILGYELIWNNLTFNTTSFVNLDEKHIQKKCDALKEYKSQGQKDYMSKDFIFSLARTRGIQIGTQFAESFEVVRWVIK